MSVACRLGELCRSYERDRLVFEGDLCSMEHSPELLLLFINRCTYLLGLSPVLPKFDLLSVIMRVG